MTTVALWLATNKTKKKKSLLCCHWNRCRSSPFNKGFENVSFMLLLKAQCFMFLKGPISVKWDKNKSCLFLAKGRHLHVYSHSTGREAASLDDHMPTVAQNGKRHFILTSQPLLERCETKTGITINTPSDHQTIKSCILPSLNCNDCVFLPLLHVALSKSSVQGQRLSSLCFHRQSVNQKPLFLQVTTHRHFRYTLTINKNISSHKTEQDYQSHAGTWVYVHTQKAADFIHEHLDAVKPRINLLVRATRHGTWFQKARRQCFCLWA